MFSRPYYTRLVPALALGFVLNGLPLAAMAQSADSSSSQAENPSERQITIEMESYQYSPPEINLVVGKTVALILHNRSFLVPHNFILEDPQGTRIVEVDISSGDQQVIHFTPTQPGIYPFYCDKQLLFFPTHREQGMEGRLLVQE